MIFLSPPISLRRIGLLALVLGSFSIQAGSSPPPPQSAAASLDELWSLAEQRLAAQALAGIETVTVTDSTAVHERRLLEALCRLQAQPRTATSLHAARDILLELGNSAETPDSVAQMAKFFLARYYEVALPAPDPTTARRTYHALHEKQPKTLIGQLALARVVLLDLAAPPSREGRLNAYAGHDGWDDRFTHPLARRDYHLLMALTGLRYKTDPHSVIHHIERACATGLLRSRTQADLLLGGATMAAQVGKPELARDWRQRFIDENPRDPRKILVGKILSGEVSL
ncbi:hypothetical protein Ga0100231_020495 [Opitutaceae bacterium TAV4]|nr:hypothetical protein Ga0100231_020495 [Opitutaceae bacterium TAV4]RRK00435.1 hypothetical protein Ga0100230_021340 [Opitutaceae bacterium TAV3]